jgi:predicted DsbA family dithiol-disulfide isomerase
VSEAVRITVTYYLDVISSWCYWAEPAWAELKQRYQDRVDFQWKIGLMDSSGLPTSHEQHDWFYRRSGTLMRSAVMLRSDWISPGFSEYLAPNCIAEAARDLGVTDDRVRLAIAHAGLREAKKIGEWDVSAEAAARAGGLDPKKLLDRARSDEVEKRIRTDTATFHSLQVTQRPTFVLDSEIGDRAVFSGFAKAGPMAAALDSMLDEAEAYISFAAHFGNPPP